MSESESRGAGKPQEPVSQLAGITLNLIDPDAALLRVCAGLERLRAVKEEMEQAAASLTPYTVPGRRMKKFTREQYCDAGACGSRGWSAKAQELDGICSRRRRISTSARCR